MKLVKAIKEGRIKVLRPGEVDEEAEEKKRQAEFYMLWKDEDDEETKRKVRGPLMGPRTCAHSHQQQPAWWAYCGNGPSATVSYHWLSCGCLCACQGPRHISAPKIPLPGHAESYNPPEEYLFTAVRLPRLLSACVPAYFQLIPRAGWLINWWLWVSLAM
jgi:hypothetical protein